MIFPSVHPGITLLLWSRCWFSSAQGHIILIILYCLRRQAFTKRKAYLPLELYEAGLGGRFGIVITNSNIYCYYYYLSLLLLLLVVDK